MWEIVQKLLNDRKMNMRDLSRATGVAYGSLGDWKAGRSTPKIDKIRKIAAFFGVTPEYILCGKDDDYLREDERALLLAYNTLNADGKKEALKRIREMSEISHFRKDTEYSAIK